MTKSLYTQLLQPTSIVSVTFSSMIPLTVILFPKMVINKIFMEIILCISICDILGNWPYTMGWYPANGTPLCTFEGFCNLYFLPVSWVYTTMLTCCLASLVLYNRIVLTRSHIHSVSLLVPFILCMLTLTTNTFGTDSSGEKSCSYGGSYYSGEIWHAVVYSGFLIFNAIIMIALLGKLLYLEVIDDPRVRIPSYKIAKQALLLYPVAMIICWFPHATSQCIVGYQVSDTVQYVFDMMKILHGAIASLIFFSHSKEAAMNWAVVLGYVMPSSTRKHWTDWWFPPEPPLQAFSEYEATSVDNNNNNRDENEGELAVYRSQSSVTRRQSRIDLTVLRSGLPVDSVLVDRFVNDTVQYAAGDINRSKSVALATNNYNNNMISRNFSRSKSTSQVVLEMNPVLRGLGDSSQSSQNLNVSTRSTSNSGSSIATTATTTASTATSATTTTTATASTATTTATTTSSTKRITDADSIVVPVE